MENTGFQGYLSALKNKGGVLIPGRSEITIKDIDEIADMKVPSSIAPIHLSLRQLTLLKISIEWIEVKKQYRIFNTSTKVDLDCFWFTPLNKGSLWKIKATLECYYVYYGTFKKLYATRFNDCMVYIIEQIKL